MLFANIRPWENAYGKTYSINSYTCIMSRNYKIHNQSVPYFISFSVVYWIDVFIRPCYKDIFVDSINYCSKEKGLKVYAWVIMSSHVHMVIGTNPTSLKLRCPKKDDMQDIIRNFKRHTSKKL